MVARCRHHARHRSGCDIPDMVCPCPQRMGHYGRDTLSLWHAMLLHRLHHLPCLAGLNKVERAPAQMGSCRYLLAHRRFLFPHYTHCHAQRRRLGVVAFHFCVGGSDNRHGGQLR